MYTVTNEIELLRASLTGNKEAFGTIVENYQSLICGITYSATGDFARSEELAQETFLRAWKELKQLKDLGKFHAWLCTIARNLVKKAIGKQSKDVIDSARPIENVAAFETSELTPDEAAISKEQQTVIWQALQEIPQTYREPMVLFYRQQQSIKQVAAELDLSEEVAKQRLLRGRKLLKAEVSSLVEDILGRTGPKKTFTIAVIAALPALVPQAASAAVAGAVAKGVKAAKYATLLNPLGALIMPLLQFCGSIIIIRESFANTKSPRERDLQKNILFYRLLFVTVSLIIICPILGALFHYHRIAFYISAALFSAGFGILVCIPELKRKVIQIEDGTYIEPVKRLKTNGQIYGEFSMVVFGYLVLVHMTSIRAKDWLTVWFILFAGILIFIVSTQICLRKRQHFNRIIYGTFTIVGILILLVVNLRWERWLSELPKYRNISLLEINLIICTFMAGVLLLKLIVDLYKKGKER